MTKDVFETLVIRDATEADLPRLVAIYNAAIETRLATADLEPFSVEARRPWFHQHQPGRFPLWVAEVDGTVAGYLSASPWRTMVAYAKTAQYALYVSAEFQGRGIGEKLVRKLQNDAESLGLDNLMGVIFSDNFPSLRLCRKLGFSEWGYLPGVTEFSGKPRDVIFLGWRRG